MSAGRPALDPQVVWKLTSALATHSSDSLLPVLRLRTKLLFNEHNLQVYVRGSFPEEYSFKVKRRGKQPFLCLLGFKRTEGKKNIYM